MKSEKVCAFPSRLHVHPTPEQPALYHQCPPKELRMSCKRFSLQKKAAGASNFFPTHCENQS